MLCGRQFFCISLSKFKQFDHFMQHYYDIIRDANFSRNVIKTVGNIPEISEKKIGNIPKFSDLQAQYMTPQIKKRMYLRPQPKGMYVCMYVLHLLRTNMSCKWDGKRFICTNRRCGKFQKMYLYTLFLSRSFCSYFQGHEIPSITCKPRHYETHF